MDEFDATGDRSRRIGCTFGGFSCCCVEVRITSNRSRSMGINFDSRIPDLGGRKVFQNAAKSLILRQRFSRINLVKSLKYK